MDNMYIEYNNAYDTLYKYGYNNLEIMFILNNVSTFKYDISKIEKMINNGYKYLLNRGYSLDDIKKMTLNYPGVLFIGDKKRKSIEDLFLDLGMSFLEFKEISLKCVNICSYSKDKICSYIEFFRSLGYYDKDIVKIFKIVPIIFRVSVNNLNKFYEDMITYGISKEEVLCIGRNFPSFWSHNFNKVKDIMDTFICIGFDIGEAKKIIKSSPSLIGYDKNTILRKFDELIKLGFSREELINIIILYPNIITCDIDRTNNILCFFKEIGMYEILLSNPKYFFMQGIESSYAKYCFYIENDIDINKDNYRKLFLEWKRFEERFGMNKNDLLNKYSYDEYRKSVGNKK